MNVIIDYFVPPHDPIIGIEAATLVERLNSDNWHLGAIIRRQQSARHYIYLSRATCARTRTRYYCVNTYDLDQGLTLSRQLFETAADALNFANDPATSFTSHNRTAA